MNLLVIYQEGQKKLLELGRTMMVDAKLVLLDEVGGRSKQNFT